MALSTVFFWLIQLCLLSLTSALRIGELASRILRHLVLLFI